MFYTEDWIISISAIIYLLILMTFIILLIIQGFKNIEYNKFNSLKIIKERVLYEQISYEIYNNIQKNIILDLQIQDICENNYQPINFEIKLNPNYNYKYSTNINHLFNIQFCVPIYENFKNEYNVNELKYEELIRHSINIENIKNLNLNDENSLNNICENGFKPCGILDTLNNILCLPNKYNCPLNDLIISSQNNSKLKDKEYYEKILDNDISLYLNTQKNIDRPIIISNFLSFDKPWDHEWQKIIGYKDSKKGEKDNLKREKFPFENYDKYMTIVPFQNFSFITLNNILNWEKENNNLKSMVKDAEPSQFYYLFHKNFIGFKNYDELIKFKNLFNIDDYKKNPLFKFSTTLRPYIATIVVGLITLLILLTSLILLIIAIKDKSKEGILIISIIMASIALIYFIVYISLYFIDKAKFKKLDFSFDPQIQIVFNSYSKRRNKPIYKAAIILMFISVAPHAIIIIIFLGAALYHLVCEIKKYCDFCGIF